MDRIQIGRRDLGSGHFPEVDLRSFYEAGSDKISRRHAEVLYRANSSKHYLKCTNDNPWTQHVESGSQSARTLELNDEVELKDGDRFIIGEEVSFRVVVP